MTETQLQEAIIGKRGLARILGWHVTHSRPAMIKDPANPNGYSWRTAIQGDAGFPDVLLAKELFPQDVGRLIIAEFKGDRGDPTPDQRAWLEVLSTVEVLETYLWRPGDLEEIKDILTLSHVPNLIERAEFKSSWINRREEMIVRIEEL